MSYGAVYCITNAVNGRQYVGQTTTNIARRWQWHQYYARHNHRGVLYSAIRKYGPKAFTISLLCEENSSAELNEKEVFYITLLKTLVPLGYNISTGGGGTSGWHPTEETRLKQSRANTGRKRSEESRQNMSDAPRHRKPISDIASKKLARVPGKERCRRGHSFNELNTYVRPSDGMKVCLTCWYLLKGKRLPRKLIGDKNQTNS